MKYRRRHYNWYPHKEQTASEIEKLEEKLCILHGEIAERMDQRHWVVNNLRWLRRRQRQMDAAKNKNA